MEDYAEKFAKRLRSTWGDKAQTELVALMKQNGFEITPGRLSHYMTGRNSPDPEVLAELAKAMGVSADYLLMLTDEELPVADLSEQLANSKGEGKIDRLMKAMSPEQRRQVITYAEYLLAQSGQADAVAGDDQAALIASLNVLQRKYGADADALLENIADIVPALRKVIGPPPPKNKGVNSG
jgi:transcriptional regulator with XRE-family HTH domain